MKYIANRTYLLLSVLFLVGLLMGCSSMEPVQKQSTKPSQGSSTQTDTKPTDAISNTVEINWSDLREDLNYPNKAKKTDLDLFKTDIQSEDNAVYTGIVQGYRVQIESTRDLVQADSLKNLFNYKIQQLDPAYKPESYIIYKPPYYRIRVGDFKERNKALEYTRYLKKYYPSCWVVADEIEPQRVPVNNISLDPAIKSTANPIDSTGIKRRMPY